MHIGYLYIYLGVFLVFDNHQLAFMFDFSMMELNFPRGYVVPSIVAHLDLRESINQSPILFICEEKKLAKSLKTLKSINEKIQLKLRLMLFIGTTMMRIGKNLKLKYLEHFKDKCFKNERT
ncbi:hypothetical protein AVEN_240116-1 [Araneus ventricosus]|uniref:Uncharacterized protein n=1 Tax=Araneus ventricosus TaxID=182803 RepID=A0A4Y2R2W2_ARAVE|nr:hypothetical protein AVEN_240116-1 [Araneus ventricosus]